MVVLAGGGHIQYGFGIPRRVFARLPLSYTTILPITNALPEGRDDLIMDVEVPDLPLPLADFVWSLPYRDLSESQLRLGVMLDRHKTDGLWVGSVMAGSAADEAGVLAGDRLTMLDGASLAELVDLRVVLTEAKPGQVGTLVVMRGEETVSLPLTYRTAAEQQAAAAKLTEEP
jgi:predicted metalloprotease with PDZ domain